MRSVGRLAGAGLLSLGYLLCLMPAASGARALPEDLLNFPIQILIDEQIKGSGFYLVTSSALYLVSTKHLIYDKVSGRRNGKVATLLSYTGGPKAESRNILKVNLETLETAGEITKHEKQDVLVIRLGTVKSDTGNVNVTFLDQVKAMELVLPGLVHVSPKRTGGLDRVLVGNEVFIFGYPASLGLRAAPQIEESRPLLRKGIVAGINHKTGTVILDCPVYRGNSGGPVVQVEEIAPGRREYLIIGLVSEWVPFAEEWLNTTQGYSNLNLSNSGYSVAVPMDAIYELLGRTKEER